MWLFLVFCIFQGINCSFPTFRVSLKDQCIKLCQEEKLPVLNKFFHDNIENIICRSGCRLFDIQYGGGLDVSPALKDCQIGCKHTFVREGEINICYIGCNQIASKVQNQIQRILVMSPQERYKKNLVLNGPETDGVDSVDTDFLSDPSIKSQLEVGFNVDYKIPETFIRTMPIENKDKLTKVVLIKPKEKSDWLDCASKNSGIPRWILLSTMLGAIMVAIWLTLTMESRKSPEECDDMLVDADEKCLENYTLEKDCALLENGAFEVVSEKEVEFVPPPKYSEVNELDNSEPPNYSEAIQFKNTRENV